MKKSVYVETSVISYLAAWPSRDLVRATHQQVTREWWAGPRRSYDLFISQAVLDEAGEGDPIAAAADRIRELKDISVLTTPNEVPRIVREIMRVARLPAKAETDALHIAIAAYHRMNFLLTWNCRHINNAEFEDKFEQACGAQGFVCPRICNPEELLGEFGYEE